MRRIVVGLSVLALILLAGMAMAGDYHSAELTVCSDCHTAHYSLSHNYAGGDQPANGSGLTGSMGDSGPYDRLLKNEVNHLCLSCHDGQAGIADVVGDNAGHPGIVRQAGALNLDSDLGANDAGYDTYMGHTLGVKATVAPGGTFTTNATHGLECVDCHTPHGSGRGATDLNGASITNPYRNVLSMDTVAGVRRSMTYEIGATSTNTKDVLERVARVYDQSNVDFEKPVANESGYGKYCMTCHQDFHGGVTNASAGNTHNALTGDFYRHPTAEATFDASHSGTWVGASYSPVKTNFVKVMSDTNAWGKDATNLSPSCFSCHKAHGNKNAFGLIQMAGNTGTISEEGSTVNTGMRSLCKQCHGMGGTAL